MSELTDLQRQRAELDRRIADMLADSRLRWNESLWDLQTRLRELATELDLVDHDRTRKNVTTIAFYRRGFPGAILAEVHLGQDEEAYGRCLIVESQGRRVEFTAEAAPVEAVVGLVRGFLS